MIESYLQHGWSMIPIQSRGKRPVGQWAHAQDVRADPRAVDAWVEEGMNLAVVTGQLSGVVVVDCDSDAGVLEAQRRGIPITPTATTGKGRHYYFAWTGATRNAVRLADDVDVRGDGGYVLIPPSVHPNGESYRWVDGLSLEDVPMAPCPDWVRAGQRDDGVRREDGAWGRAFGEPVGNGRRNHTCAELAGYLLRRWVEEDAVTELLLMWNQARCNPPMTKREVVSVVRSIAAREERRRSGRT